MRLAVFCGSSHGHHSAYRQAAQDAGALLAARNITVVYGGGSVGLMGVVAEAALQAGGQVIGVITEALKASEVAQQGLSELIVVDTMHERKQRMADLADGFICLPGGAGTLEEIFEQWTWVQLGIHGKPCGFLSVRDYYRPLQQMVSHVVKEGFIHQTHADILQFADDLPTLLERFAAYRPPQRKWVGTPSTNE